MPGLPELEAKGQFIFSETNLTKEPVVEKDLHPEDKVVLLESPACKIEIRVKENEADVSIFYPGGASVTHLWNPSQREFTRRPDMPLNHGVSFNSEKQSISVELTKDGERIRRTVFWRPANAGVTRS